MGELKAIVTKKAEVHEDVVKMLENALELARKGELTGIAIAGEYRDGCSYSCSSKSLNKLVLIASMEIIKFRMINSLEKE